MKTRHICSIIVLLAAILGMATGCVTKPLPPQPIEYTFTEKDFPVSTELPIHPERPGELREIAKLGIALGDIGQHEKAAGVFLQGAQDFSSQGKRIEQAFVQAAIMEHFKAGKMNLVREDFKKLDGLRPTPYSRYDDNESIRKIRLIVNATEQ
ncbi:MAG: hypothetical protein IJS08_01190 [Victivallales bacterium]|nr:hypothetical protein [Victivallales bacterium]